MRIAVFLGLVVVAVTSCTSRRPVRLIIQDGTAGWVKVNFGRAGAPKIPVEDGIYTIRVPQNRKVETSDDKFGSLDNAEFYYETRDGKRVRLSANQDDNARRIWAGEYSKDKTGEHLTFFVGRDEQFTRVLVPPGSIASGILETNAPKKEEVSSAEFFAVK
jgi:hypothetical protein